MPTAAEFIRKENEREARNLAWRRDRYDARLKGKPAAFRWPCGQCRRYNEVGDIIIRPGGKRFSHVWYCYSCGLAAHACDRPLTQAEYLKSEELRMRNLKEPRR